MKKGQKLVYGSNDREHAIDCTYTGEYKITRDGRIIISASCGNNATITAPIEMFKRV